MQAFINYIKQYVLLSEGAENAITNVTETNQLNKDDLLLEEGKTCKYLYFLVDGSVRTFHYHNGKDITYWIYPKHSLFTSWTSYFLQQPSSEYIETTSDATIIGITYEKWQELYNTFPELERFGRLILEEQMTLIDGFYRGYYFLTAKEKYELLITAYPTITQIANLGHIASMLGISQETLSRVRGK